MDTNELNNNEVNSSSQKTQKVSKKSENAFNSVDHIMTFVVLVIVLSAICVYVFSLNSSKNRLKDNYYLSFESYEAKSNETIVVFKRENKIWHLTEHKFCADDFSIVANDKEIKGSGIKSSNFYPSDEIYEWVHTEITVVDDSFSIRFVVKKEDLNTPVIVYYLGQKFEVGQRVNYK